MAIFKTEKDIRTIKEAGRRLAFVLDAVIKQAVPGVTERDLDRYARELIEKGGDRPAFLHYKPDGASSPYPATLCISVNDEVVHGIPTDRALRKGDIVSLDIGLIHRKTVVDMAKTVPIVNIDENAAKLLAATEQALKRGIAAAKAGAHVGDIGAAISSSLEGTPFSVVPELGGHGTGRCVHEPPFIANFGVPGSGPKLEDGSVVALEPIVNEGGPEVALSDDGYTYRTRDGKRSAHFEHTILVTKNGAEIVTI